MCYNEWLEKWNQIREEEKLCKIDQLVNEVALWSSNSSEIDNKKLWDNKYDKVVLSLYNAWKISWKEDLNKKILHLHEDKWYSFDQIWKALSKFVFEIESWKVIDLHKQTISRVIGRELKKVA